MRYMCFETMMQKAVRDLESMGIVEKKLPLSFFEEEFRKLLSDFDDVGKEGFCSISEAFLPRSSPFPATCHQLLMLE